MLFHNKLANKFCTVGFIVSVLSVFFTYVIKPVYVKYSLQSKLQLQPGSDMWNVWVSYPFPGYFKLYLFNVTNPEDILQRGAKPILREMGPYVYEQWMSRDNIQLSTDRNTVSFKDNFRFNFRPDLSNGSESDVATVVNVPYVTVAGLTKSFGATRFQMYLIFNVYLRGENLFVRDTVRNLLWDGMDVSKYFALQKLTPLGGFALPDVYTRRNDIKDGFASLLDEKNNTGESLTVYTGIKGQLTRLGEIKSWNGHVGYTDTWIDKTCNQINGTDKTIYSPHVSKEKDLYIFIPKFCRTLHGTYHSDRVFKGIPTYHFRLPEELFSYGEKNPDNWCFCTADGKCPPNGLLNVTNCAGAPLMYSHAFFAMGDPSLRDAVEGLREIDESEHVSFFDIEPTSGIMVRGASKIQVNVEVQRFADIPGLEMVPEIMFPLFWFEEIFELDEPNVNFVYYAVVLPLKLADIIAWAAFGCGGVVCLAAIAFQYVLLLRNSHLNDNMALCETDSPYRFCNINECTVVEEDEKDSFL